jgi:thiol-disulfide isomerase/thioredoxin
VLKLSHIDMKHLRVIAVLVLVFVLGAYIGNSSAAATGEISDGVDASSKVVPVWSLTDINGKVIRSTDLKGKVVILDFWATWCGPCHEEIPGFVDLQKQFGDEGLTVVGASVDEGGVPVVKKFVSQFGVNYSVGIASDSLQSTFGGIDALPTTFIIDRQGRLMKKHIGFTDKSEFESEIRPLLQSK